MTDDVTEPTDHAGDLSGPRSDADPAGRPWLVPGLAVALVASVIAAVLVLTSPGDPPAVAADVPPTSTATSTSTSTTSTLPTIPDVGRWDTTIASATGTSVEAFAERPVDPAAAAGTGGAADPATVTSDDVGALVRQRQQAEAGWASYSSGPEDSEIPALDRPVEGRQRTATGWMFANPSGWGGPLTFTVTEDHGAWLKVMLPVRPNGTEGWIRAADVTLSHTTFHVHIAVGSRTLTVFDGDTLVLSTPVVVGKDDTLTPRGRFYVTDAVEKHSGSSYGPWILPLSGFSQSLDEFGGGAPVIAIHGTNRPELAGTAASNGCIRVPADATITQMHDQLPMGTPVDITD